ncbi:protein-glutamate methylesterase/protein-glutamine glutaminase [Granulosicoccus antarcticus]|uniref:Protein-glutamate methylesterase/protein-glutamine glutaminase n=1 Tax=Granulosicoccus antarcticus IMCC3135 TaxID=1192854 RepID=A0A2Z2NKI7_9GAMM|nr:chemotaxis response regulator protein-glutamate methylesterase [Granulosicoccus antarcticus]ASJ70398.1 Chemotaxis response regulator protein-glutamate methylesterase [Granulosicoccus antarcticus IMCC3135]
MQTKRVLVVDDSSMYQRLLSDVINTHPELEVVGVATNGKQALQLVESLRPDVVTLDILMPEMDGIQALLELRRQWPEVRTIMVSSLTSEGSDAALDALTLGAHEYAMKPDSTGGVSSIRSMLSDDLLPKIEALCGLASNSIKPQATQSEMYTAPNSMPLPVNLKRSADHLELVVIGVSTGGPDALTKLLLQLPADFEVPVCIVQHMPAEFTGKLAARLNSASKVSVREAQAGDRLEPGTVYIAPGDFHMVLERVGLYDFVRLNKNPLENSCRPSVDPLFRSAAAIHGARCLGVVLTGMGQDGFKGSEVLYTAGATIIVQDEASSVVWGMPRLIAQAGLAEAQVPLDRMATAILDRVRAPGRKFVPRATALSDDSSDVEANGQRGLRGHGS